MDQSGKIKSIGTSFTVQSLAFRIPPKAEFRPFELIQSLFLVIKREIKITPSYVDPDIAWFESLPSEESPRHKRILDGKSQVFDPDNIRKQLNGEVGDRSTER